MKLLGKIEQAQDAVSKEYVDGLIGQGGGGNVSNLVTKKEFEDLINEILDNEEVVASAFNDLNTRLAALRTTAIQYVDNAIASAITNPLNTAV